MDIKNNEELANMSVEELAGYYNTLNEAKAHEMEEALKSKSSKEEVAKLYNEYKKDIDSQMEKLNSVLVEQGLTIKKMNEVDHEKEMVIASSLKGGLSKNIEKLKGLKSSLAGARDNEFTMEVKNPQVSNKAAATMTYAGGAATLGEIPLPFREAGVYDERRSTLGFLPFVETIATQSNVISWVKKTNRENEASHVAEGSEKPLSDFALTVEEVNVVKYANFIKVSTEMLDDISFLEGEINRELIGNVLEKVDKDCFTGTGAGKINGILTAAGTTYAAGNYAGTVDAPNLVDVIVTAAAQMSGNFYKASRIFLHPKDVAALKLVKATDNQYINRIMQSGESLTIDGMPVSESYHMTEGDFALVDMNEVRMYVKEDMGLEFGMSGDDFTKNLRTILTEWRGILRIVDAKAIVHGDISTAVTALTKA